MLPGAKIILAWALGGLALTADVQLFSQDSVLSAIVVGVIAAFTIWATYRTNAIKFWRDTAEGATARCRELEQENKRQRELKHTALAEVAALTLRTDMGPLLERIVVIQEGQELRARREEQMSDAIEAVASSQSQIADTLAHVAEVAVKILNHVESGKA